MEESCCTPEDQLFLLNAIEQGDRETVQFLIFGQQICPDFVLNGQSPIVVAAKNGREDILDILIQCNGHLNTPDFSDDTWMKRPIHIAAAKGYLGIVKKLVENGVFHSCVDKEFKTPIHWAALFGHDHVIEYLISIGASVNVTQEGGFTPLHCSAALDQISACKVLLANGACPNVSDEDGWTPIHHAAAYGHYSVIKTLYEAGASLTIKTPCGDGILHITANTSKEKVDIFKFLVENKVPIDEKDECGNTALHISCFNNIYENVRCLIELGADWNMKDGDGDSLLFTAACNYDSQNMIYLLIKAGYNCSQEMWIHEERFPLALSQNMSLVRMLKLFASYPRTLQDLCYYRVLKSLGQHSRTKINMLPLPMSLKSFLINILH